MSPGEHGLPLLPELHLPPEQVVQLRPLHRDGAAQLPSLLELRQLGPDVECRQPGLAARLALILCNIILIIISSLFIIASFCTLVSVCVCVSVSLSFSVTRHHFDPGTESCLTRTVALHGGVEDARHLDQLLHGVAVTLIQLFRVELDVRLWRNI